VRWLLERVRWVQPEAPNQRPCPLLNSLGHEHEEIQAALLAHPATNIDYRCGPTGATALFWAAAQGKAASLRRFLEAESDVPLFRRLTLGDEDVGLLQLANHRLPLPLKLCQTSPHGFAGQLPAARTPPAPAELLAGFEDEAALGALGRFDGEWTTTYPRRLGCPSRS